MFDWKKHAKKTKPHFVDTTPDVVYSGVNTEASVVSFVSDTTSHYGGKRAPLIKRVDIGHYKSVVPTWILKDVVRAVIKSDAFWRIRPWLIKKIAERLYSHGYKRGLEVDYCGFDYFADGEITAKFISHGGKKAVLKECFKDGGYSYEELAKKFHVPYVDFNALEDWGGYRF